MNQYEFGTKMLKRFETPTKKEEIKRRLLIEAANHGSAIAIGDHKTANKIHKQLNLLYNKAKENDLLSVFSEMLGEGDENVKLWAATFSLTYCLDVAENVLEGLTELPNITGLTAKTTLHLWREGLLNLL